MTAPRFKSPTPERVKRSLTHRLIPLADRLRGIAVNFGVKAYSVRLVRTKWSGGKRGVGQEMLVCEEEIQPTPMLQDLTSLGEVVSPIVADEVGELFMSEVSGRYTEDQLRGLGVNGSAIPVDEQFYYEVEFLRAAGTVEQRRRRFVPSSAPSYDPTGFQWTLRLNRARGDRERGGGIR